MNFADFKSLYYTIKSPIYASIAKCYLALDDVKNATPRFRGVAGVGRTYVVLG